jgi:hypothetical protein
LKPKLPKLVFKRSIDRLKFYFSYLLLLVGAGVAHAGATSTFGCRGIAAMVAYLQATVEAVLMNLAAAALGVLNEDEGGERVLVLARPRQ